MGVGPLDGSPDGAEAGVEGDLGVVECPAGRGAVWDGRDALDSGIAEVGDGVVAGDQVFEAGGGVGVRVVAGAVDGDRADRGHVSAEGCGDLDVHAGVPGLAGVQVQDS